MARLNLDLKTKLFVWVVILIGFTLGGRLILRGDPSGWDWTTVLVFGLLGILSTLVSFRYQGFLPASITHQIGGTFIYACFLVADPGASILLFWCMTVADWAINRRYWVTHVFNLGQLSLGIVAAVAVRGWISPGFRVLDRIDPQTVAAILASLVTCVAINLLFTHAAVVLSSRRPFFSVRTMTLTGLLTEALCIVSGFGMAIFWWIRPWLIPLGFLPLAVLIVSLYQLNRRENQHVVQQAALGSLQDLGLEIGSQLDSENLYRSVVRVGSEALDATGSLLAVARAGENSLRIVSRHGLGEDVPVSEIRESFARELLATSTVRLFENIEPGSAPSPELEILDARGCLCAPLEILGERKGLLVIFHRGERRRFDSEDVARVESLVRFTNMALSNSCLVSNLREMQEQLIHTEKMSALGMLVSGVAHELNNPLTTVMGYTELLLRAEKDDKRREMLETVTGQADRARRIVRNLLTFSRKRKPEKVPSDLNRIFQEILELRAYDLRTSNIRLSRMLADDLPRVLVDPHQFQQVFLNLVTNAEHALADVEGDRTIMVASELFGDKVRVSVEDSGPGIPEADLDRIFLPFFTTKETGRGTGLGLSICYGIVQEHGGEIRARRSPVGGARFIVEVPALLSDAGQRNDPAEARQPTGEGPTGRLLVVDDEQAITLLVRDALEPKGWTVTRASNGREALQLVSENRYDVLLVDLRMPEMDGPSFFRELRETRPEMASRVAFATGDSGNPNTLEFLQSIRNPVLTKPFTVESLLTTIYQIL